MSLIPKFWERITRQTDSIAYTATVTFDPTLYTDNEIVTIGQCTGNITLTPHATNLARTGQRIFFVLSADGTNRTLTLGGTWAGPAVNATLTASKTRLLEVMYDGTNWWLLADRQTA